MSVTVVAEVGLLLFELAEAVRAGHLPEEEALELLAAQRVAIATRVKRTAGKVDQITSDREARS